MDQNMISESYRIMNDTSKYSKSVTKPPVPSIKDTIKILNIEYENTSIPAVDKTVTFNTQCGQVSNKITKQTKLIEDDKSLKNIKGNETKLYIEKKKKERTEKKKLDLLKKQKLAEERKKKLAELQKTTRALAKASIKKKTINHQDQDKCKISLNVSTASNQSEVDLTWSPPPPKIKSFDTILKTPFNNQKKSIKDLEIIYYNISNSCLNITKNDKETDLPVSCAEENCCNNEKQDDENYILKDIMSEINLSKSSLDNVNIDIATNTDVQLLNQSYKQILNSSNYSMKSQKLLMNQCSPIKTCHSESTQTDGCENLLFFSPKIQPPPLNFISIFKCKNNLQKKGNIDLEFSNPEIDLKTNHYNLNNCMDNIKSPVHSNVLEIVDSNKSLDFQNLEHMEKEDLLIRNEFELNTETIKLKSCCPSLIETTENNVCEEKSDLNNDKLLPEFDKITNKDVKKALKNLNYHFDSSTDIPNDSNMHLKCIKNNSINFSSLFHEIHDEFQAELSTLDQLNDSLYNIEKMSAVTSTKTDNSIDDELNAHSTNHSTFNDFNSKIILNTAYYNKYKPSLSKLNALSSNIMNVDKTITGFSIQMFEQLIKDEELRAKQHHTILNLREKSLINRLKWEVSMCELQMKNIKNQPGHEKHLQTFKQKQRGSVKKLEHSLSQVKRLGRVIDSVYKKRLIMLNEHLQYLKTQSSSKNVIRKLKSLDQNPKKNEYACGSLNSKCFMQCDKTDFVNTIEYEKEHVNLNPFEFNATSKYNSLQSVKEIYNPNILLQDQATSPIHTETKSEKKVKNIQTDNERSLQFNINKSTKTSKSLCNYDNNENKLTEVKKRIDKRSQLAVLPTSSTKIMQYVSETSNSTNSEQSDMELRIKTLQEQLEARKIESFLLKKEQKKLRLENLKAKEQDLLKQIELYDKKIEESKKSLMVDVEKKNIKIKHDLSTKSSNYPIFQHMIKYDIDHTTEKSQTLPESDKILLVDAEKYFYPVEIKKTINHNITSLEKPMYEKNIAIESKTNFNKYADECGLNDTNDTYSETNVCEVVLIPKEVSAREVETSKKLDKVIQTEVNNIFMKSQPSNILVESSTEEIQSNKLNTIVDTSINSLCNSFILNLKAHHISSNQELCLEKNTNSEKLSISCSNINNYLSSISSSSSSDSERKFSVDFNETDTMYEKNKNNTNPLEISNNDIEVDNDYSLDFTSVENTSECQKSYENIMELPNEEQNNESSSYEEDRSEGDVMFEDKTFIDQFSDDGYLVHNEMASSDKVDVITNNIFNNLLKDSKVSLKSNMSKTFVHSEKSDLDNVTDDTPLLMILKREEEHQHIVFLSEQARNISNVFLNRNLHQILSEILPVFLSRLNEEQLEKLQLYLNWSSSKRKKLKFPKCFSVQHETNDVDNAESFEIFYQKYLEQKDSQTIQDESSGVILSQSTQEAEKLKLEQIRIEKEIERLHMTEKTQFVQRSIPIKPPPPYKSPTKKKSHADIPYTSDEMYKIVLTAASQLFNNDFQLSLLKDYVIDSDSNLHADYKTLIFDYCKEIVQETVCDQKNVPIWKKNSKRLKNFRLKPENPKDLTDTVVKKINQIIDFDECEEKVNKFVVKQMYEEDSKWFDFQMDELNIENDIVENLMQKLLCDTITDIKTSFYLKFMK